MIVKNIKTGHEIDFNVKSDEKLAKRLASDSDFEIISMTEEEKAILVEEKAQTISLEDKLLGREEIPVAKKKKKGC